MQQGSVLSFVDDCHPTTDRIDGPGESRRQNRYFHAAQQSNQSAADNFEFVSQSGSICVYFY